LGTIMGEPGRRDRPDAPDPARASPSSDSRGEPAAHGATAVAPKASRDRRELGRSTAAALVSALGVTLVSAIFIVCFIGGLHAPGPRSVPVGLVGSPAQAARLGAALSAKAPGAFTISSYPTEAAARNAISRRSVDAALVPGPAVQHLLVATAVSEAETNAIIKVFAAGAARAHVSLIVQDIRPLHAGDLQGLAQTFFVVGLLAPSVVFGNLLISRIGRRLNEYRHLAMIAVYALIVAAVATAIADAGIRALTGAPWGVYGVGVLLAFAAAVMGAATTRCIGGIGYVVLLLLFVPVGISSSGSTLGPRMITRWYADLGRALPPGAAMPAVRNVTYFNGNALVEPLLVLSAWALAGSIALAAAAIATRTHARPSQPAGGSAS
jgi:hypothetical protein